MYKVSETFKVDSLLSSILIVSSIWVDISIISFWQVYVNSRDKENRIQILRRVFAQWTRLWTAPAIDPTEVIVDLNVHAEFSTATVWFTSVPVSILKRLQFFTWLLPYKRTTAVVFDQLLTACPKYESPRSMTVQKASRVTYIFCGKNVSAVITLQRLVQSAFTRFLKEMHHCR